MGRINGLQAGHGCHQFCRPGRVSPWGEHALGRGAVVGDHGGGWSASRGGESGGFAAGASLPTGSVGGGGPEGIVQLDQGSDPGGQPRGLSMPASSSPPTPSGSSGHGGVDDSWVQDIKLRVLEATKESLADSMHQVCRDLTREFERNMRDTLVKVQEAKSWDDVPQDFVVQPSGGQGSQPVLGSVRDPRLRDAQSRRDPGLDSGRPVGLPVGAVAQPVARGGMPGPRAAGPGSVGPRFVGPASRVVPPWQLPTGRSFGPRVTSTVASAPRLDGPVPHAFGNVEAMDTTPPPASAFGSESEMLAAGGNVGGAWRPSVGSLGAHPPASGNWPFFRGSQSAESVGSAASNLAQSQSVVEDEEELGPTFSLPPDLGDLVRHMSWVTGIPVAEAPVVEPTGYALEGEQIGFQGEPGIPHSNRLAQNLLRQGTARAKGRLKKVDRDVNRRIRMSPDTYDAVIRPLPLPASMLDVRVGNMGNTVQRLVTGSSYKSWTSVEEVARNGFRATELMGLTQAFLEGADRSNLEGEAFEEAFPEERIAQAWDTMRACLDSVRRQLSRSVALSVHERRLATVHAVGIHEKGEKQLRDYLLQAPLFSPAAPDLFAGRYDEALAKSAERFAAQQMLNLAREAPGEYFRSQRRKASGGGNTTSAPPTRVGSGPSKPPVGRGNSSVGQDNQSSSGQRATLRRRNQRRAAKQKTQQSRSENSGGQGSGRGSGRGRGRGKRS